MNLLYIKKTSKVFYLYEMCQERTVKLLFIQDDNRRPQMPIVSIWQWRIRG